MLRCGLVETEHPWPIFSKALFNEPLEVVQVDIELIGLFDSILRLSRPQVRVHVIQMHRLVIG